MNTIATRCDACGALLEIPADARFATCNSCGSQLEIIRTDSTVSTKTNQSQSGGPQGAELEKLRLQTELLALDAEWSKEREKLLVRNAYGAPYVPTTSRAIPEGIWKAVVGAILIAFISGKLPPDRIEAYMKKTGTWVEHSREYSQTEVFAILLGCGLILWGMVGGYLGYEKAVAFENARSRYLQARQKCEERLRKL
ncbi:MAG: hypothetical protein RL088_815 [Verrucomicrobiota bacterium]|jgi:hypothetical protein